MKQKIYLLLEYPVVLLVLLISLVIFNYLLWLIEMGFGFTLLTTIAIVIHLMIIIAIITLRNKIIKVFRSNKLESIVKIAIFLSVILYANLQVFVFARGPVSYSYPNYPHEYSSKYWYFDQNHRTAFYPWVRIGLAYITETLSVPEGYISVPIPFYQIHKSYNNITSPAWYFLSLLLTLNQSILLTYFLFTLKRKYFK